MGLGLTLFFAGSMLGLLPAVVASRKGYDFGRWWFFGTLLFVVAMPRALMLRPDRRALERQAIQQGALKCPSCAELIKREAVVCRYCGREVPREEAGEPSIVASAAFASRQDR